MSAIAHGQTKYENICTESSGTCALVSIQGNQTDFLTANQTVYSNVRIQSPQISIALVNQQTVDAIKQGPIDTTNLGIAEEEAYEAALDDLQISGAACLTTGGACAGLLGTGIFAGAKFKFSVAAKLIGAGVVSCFTVKPTCRDVLRKYDKFMEARQKFEAALNPQPQGGGGSVTSNPEPGTADSRAGSSGPDIFHPVIGSDSSSATAPAPRQPAGGGGTEPPDIGGGSIEVFIPPPKIHEPPPKTETGDDGDIPR